jgi:hypothetical protein
VDELGLKPPHGLERQHCAASRQKSGARERKNNTPGLRPGGRTPARVACSPRLSLPSPAVPSPGIMKRSEGEGEKGLSVPDGTQACRAGLLSTCGRGKGRRWSRDQNRNFCLCARLPARCGRAET